MVDFNLLVKGDEDALSDLISEYSQKIVRYCYSVLCNYSDAEDAAQLTFIKVYFKRKNIKSEQSLNAFIFRIALHTSIDIIRKKRGIPVANISDEMGGSYSEGFDTEFPEDLKNALLSLSPKDRALVVGRVVNEMSFDEIAEVHGKSAQTLRKRYERARKKMANYLNTIAGVDDGNQIIGQNQSSIASGIGVKIQ